MGSKICMNASCGTTTTDEWKRGWPLRSGGYADLCCTCGAAYDNMVFCDTFHMEEPGWRECYLCGKRLHCGCIASRSLLELLDFGGVGCTNCAKSYQLHSIQCDRISNGFGSVRVNNAGSLESIVENSVNRVDEGKIAQLCRLMEASESNLLRPSETDTNSCLGKYRQDDRHPTGDLGAGFSTVTQSPSGSCKFAKPENIRSMLDMSNVHGSLNQPSLSMTLGVPPGNANFIAFPGGTVEGREQGKSPSQFQQVQRARTILPKPSKAGNAISSDTNKAMIPELRIARPPGEGRGKSQLLPRYWPRITDQELQQLSGDLNSNIVPLFEKVLSASDAGRIGRLVLPKACAEAYFPSITQSEGVPLRIQDIKGREWTFQFRFWPNNNSRMYVLEGVTPCIQSMQLQAGDTITFSRIDPGGKLVIGFRKSTNNSQDTQDAETSGLPNGAASGETSFSAEGDIGWNKNENSGGRVNGDSVQQQVAVTEKKRTRNIGPKSKRLLMHSEDALELRLTWEEAQDLLRPPPTVKPSIVTIDDHEFEEYDEPPVFGKRTIFTARPSGGPEQWAQCDDCSKWRKLPVDALLPPKWTCLENVWDSSRCACSAPEEMSSKDLDNLLRMSKDLKKRRIMENHKPPLECEPSGLDALASAAVLEENVDPESSIGATTKHPRHRPGCTCIVCIQPPSGKGKHKPTCICNVCMTVKRRFKTLMLRKKKRLSERESAISMNGNNDLKGEPETNGTLENAVLHSTHLENERNQSGKQTEVAESSTKQIDLNCHPNREDVQVDVPGLSMNHVNAANPPLDDYVKQNAFPYLVREEQASRNSFFSQTNDDSLRRLSDDALLASLGWDRDTKGD